MGHDADHGGGNAIDPHRLPDDGGIASVALFPEAMTQNHDRRGAGHRIRRDKITSDSRFLANQLEGIGRDLRGAAGFRKSTPITERYPQIGHSTHSDKRLRLRPPILEIGIGDTAGPARADVQDPLAPVDRSRSLEENRLRHGENGDIDADTQREHQHGHSRETTRPAQSAEGIANVIHEAIHREKY